MSEVVQVWWKSAQFKVTKASTWEREFVTEGAKNIEGDSSILLLYFFCVLYDLNIRWAAVPQKLYSCE